MKNDESEHRNQKRMSKPELSKRLHALQKASADVDCVSRLDQDLQEVLHELEVSQIELEVQNRELIESRFAIEESHERYLNLYDFAPVAYMTLDQLGTVRELNLAAADLLGVDRMRMLNRGIAPRILKSDLLKFREHLSKLKIEGIKICTVLHLVNGTDAPTRVQLSSTSSRDRSSGEMLFKTAVSDLREQKRAEDERSEFLKKIESARNELFDFFMQAPAAVAVLTGPEHLFKLANAPFREFVGSEVIGKTFAEAFVDSQQIEMRNALDDVFDTGKPFVGREIVYSKNKNGDLINDNCFLNLSLSAFRSSQGDIRGVLVFGQDVTEQVQARKLLEFEKERDIHNQEVLEIQIRRAKDANEAKSAFLANMSHEIRTPLGAILGFTELISNSDSYPERAGFAAVVSRNGKSLTKLIDDILDLSKVEAGKLELERIDFNLRILVDEIVDLFRESAQKKLIDLRVSVDPAIPEIVNSDPTRLRQILINLIGNASKFTTKGSISVKVDAVLKTESFVGMKFFIQDTGIGMTPEQAAKLFEPFAQADSSTTRKFGGSGLGLVLSRRLACALGGNVSVEACAPRNGCTFLVTVDAEAGRSSFVDEAHIASAAVMNCTSRASRVLLVEDSLDNQMLVKIVLAKAGIAVDVASNGAEGVEMAERSDYDVVLMDMQMPVLDGYAATEQLRSDGYAKPIVALTAHAMLEDRQRILALGCNAHLTKPLDAKLLIETIGRVRIPLH